MDEIILRLNQAKRDRQGNWIWPNGFVIPYGKMIKLNQEAGYSGSNIRPDEDYLTLSIMNNKVTFIHYDKFTNLEFIEPKVIEEVSHDRIGE